MRKNTFYLATFNYIQQETEFITVLRTMQQKRRDPQPRVMKKKQVTRIPERIKANCGKQDYNGMKLAT